MQSNLHAPERLASEPFALYRERRAQSHRAVRSALAGRYVLIDQKDPGLREAVKAAGGIRQFKRQTYRARHVGYGLRQQA